MCFYVHRRKAQDKTHCQYHYPLCLYWQLQIQFLSVHFDPLLFILDLTCLFMYLPTPIDYHPYWKQLNYTLMQRFYLFSETLLFYFSKYSIKLASIMKWFFNRCLIILAILHQRHRLPLIYWEGVYEIALLHTKWTNTSWSRLYLNVLSMCLKDFLCIYIFLMVLVAYV